MQVLAGRPAARLTKHLAIPVSPNTLLRLLRRRPARPRAGAPRVLGVDDFATRKGHVYATILLDMETGERVDVLPDRTADTLTAWLQEHSGAQIVCRDRGGAYAEAVGLDRKTVRRYAHAPTPEDMAPARAGRHGTRVDPFLPYLHQRWNQGCTDAAQLFAEIRERGYTGSQRTVRRHLQAVRASGKPAPKVTKRFSVRRATHLITSHPPAEATTGPLPRTGSCRRLRDLLGDDDGRPGRTPLARLAQQAEATGFPPLKSLANDIRHDFDAVTAGLSTQWNSGRVEGNVNRIKRIKRDGYGRANFDLLRLQILHADWFTQGDRFTTFGSEPLSMAAVTRLLVV